MSLDLPTIERVAAPVSQLFVFEIDEAHPRWEDVQRLIESSIAFDTQIVRFNDDEVFAAEWSVIGLQLEGFPVNPKGKGWNSWLHETYDVLCQDCGIYQAQKAPLRISREPNPKKIQFFSPNWVNELVVNTRVAPLMQKNLSGFRQWSVLSKKGQISQAYVQLASERIADGGIGAVHGSQRRICQTCGAERYLPIINRQLQYMRTSFPANADLLSSFEWFGDGAFSYRLLFASQRFVHLARNSNWRGIAFSPIRIVEG